MQSVTFNENIILYLTTKTKIGINYQIKIGNYDCFIKNKIYLESNANYRLICKIVNSIPAGIYTLNVLFKINYNGFQNSFENFFLHTRGNNKLSLEGKANLNLLLIPKITKISSNSGSEFGNVIEIYGRGFSKKIEVKYNNSILLEVIEVNENKIICEVPKIINKPSKLLNK